MWRGTGHLTLPKRCISSAASIPPGQTSTSTSQCLRGWAREPVSAALPRHDSSRRETPASTLYTLPALCGQGQLRPDPAWPDLSFQHVPADSTVSVALESATRPGTGRRRECTLVGMLVGPATIPIQTMSGHSAE